MRNTSLVQLNSFCVTFTLCKVTPPPTAPPKRRYRIFNAPLNILVIIIAYPRWGFAKCRSCGDASSGLQCLLNFPDISFRVVTIVSGCLEVLETSKMPWLKESTRLRDKKNHKLSSKDYECESKKEREVPEMKYKYSLNSDKTHVSLHTWILISLQRSITS